MLINPAIFYWIGVCSNLEIIFSVFFTICIIGIGVITTIHFLVSLDGDEGALVITKSLLKKFFIALLISAIGGTFIPSKETCIEMLVASQITESNITRAQEIVDYIIDKVKENKEAK